MSVRNYTAVTGLLACQVKRVAMDDKASLAMFT